MSPASEGNTCDAKPSGLPVELSNNVNLGDFLCGASSFFAPPECSTSLPSCRNNDASNGTFNEFAVVKVKQEKNLFDLFLSGNANDIDEEYIQREQNSNENDHFVNDSAISTDLDTSPGVFSLVKQKAKEMRAKMESEKQLSAASKKNEKKISGQAVKKIAVKVTERTRLSMLIADTPSTKAAAQKSKRGERLAKLLNSTALKPKSVRDVENFGAETSKARIHEKTRTYASRLPPTPNAAPPVAREPDHSVDSSVVPDYSGFVKGIMEDKIAAQSRKLIQQSNNEEMIGKSGKKLKRPGNNDSEGEGSVFKTMKVGEAQTQQSQHRTPDAKVNQGSISLLSSIIVKEDPHSLESSCDKEQGTTEGRNVDEGSDFEQILDIFGSDSEDNGKSTKSDTELQPLRSTSGSIDVKNWYPLSFSSPAVCSVQQSEGDACKEVLDKKDGITKYTF